MPKTIYKEVKTVGQIEWPRLNEENRDLTGYGGAYEKSDGAYTVNQILDKEGMKSLKDAGSQKQPNQNRMIDGEIVVKFVRPHKVFKKAKTLLSVSYFRVELYAIKTLFFV